MTAKNPDNLLGKGNIEAASSVIANWLEGEQPRTRMVRYGAAQISTAKLLTQCLASGYPAKMRFCSRSGCRKSLGAFSTVGLAHQVAASSP